PSEPSTPHGARVKRTAKGESTASAEGGSRSMASARPKSMLAALPLWSSSDAVSGQLLSGGKGVASVSWQEKVKAVPAEVSRRQKTAAQAESDAEASGLLVEKETRAVLPSDSAHGLGIGLPAPGR